MQKTILSNSHLTTFFKFGLVGGIGFVVDAGVFYLAKDLSGIYVAKAVSFVCAVFVTWIFNRKFTFSDTKEDIKLHHEFLRYIGVMVVGGIVNYIAFFISVKSSDFILHFPLFGVAIGSLAGMVFNYINSKIFIYK